MKPFFTKALYALAITAIIASCSKDDNKTTTPTPTPTPTPVDHKAQMKHEWHIVGATSNVPIDYNEDGTFETDFFAVMPPCEQDNIFSFDTDTTYAVKEGNTKCNAGDPDVLYRAKWSIDYPTLILINDQTHTIQKLDDHNLVFTLSLSVGQQTQIFTYSLAR